MVLAVLPNLAYGVLTAQDQLWWEYLHHRDWLLLLIRVYCYYSQPSQSQLLNILEYPTGDAIIPWEA